MRRILLALCVLLITGPAWSQSSSYPPSGPFDPSREQSPGRLHTMDSFAEALNEENRQGRARQRVRELEDENDRLKRQLEQRDRYEKASEHERRTLDLLKMNGR